MKTTTIVALVAMMTVAGSESAWATGSVSAFARAVGAQTGQHHYVFGLRAPRRLAKLAKAVGLERWVVQRDLAHVSNENFAEAIRRTSGEELLAVTIPAVTGHVLYRLDSRVSDFGDKGFRTRDARPGRSERYDVVVKIPASRRSALKHYLERLEQTGAAELGTYDYRGKKGYHCVTFIMRPEAMAVDREIDQNLVKLLGGKPKDGTSMIRFANFLVRRAKSVEGILFYRNGELKPKELDSAPIRVITHRQMRQARLHYLAEQANAEPGDAE